MKSEHKTIAVTPETKKKLFIYMAKSGFDSWQKFMDAIVKVLTKYKPEMEDLASKS